MFVQHSLVAHLRTSISLLILSQSPSRQLIYPYHFLKDCKLGSAKCTNIHCTIRFLEAGDDVTFTVISRLWNGTMIEVSY